MARRPSLASARLRRGQLHILRGDWRRGAADLQSALALLPPTAAALEPRLFCHENLARWLASAGRPEEALGHYGAAIALRPDRAGLYLRRGECHDSLGRPDLAEADYRTALASDLPADELPSASAALGRLRACEGRVKRAVAHYYAALPTSAASMGRTRAPTEPTFDLVRLIQAHDALAEDVVNWYGKMDVARLIYRHKLDLQERLAPSDPLGPSGVLVLPDDWVRNIGHMGAIDSVLKLIRIGWRSWRRVLLLAPARGTANRHYLTCLREHVTVVTDPTLCASLAPLAKAAFGFQASPTASLSARLDELSSYFLPPVPLPALIQGRVGGAKSPTAVRGFRCRHAARPGRP